MWRRSNLQLSQLKLQHVLAEGLNKHGREKLGVGLHLRQKSHIVCCYVQQHNTLDHFTVMETPRE